MAVRGRPAAEEIPDQEHERLFDRVAAVDVGKAFGMVCVRLPDEARPGRRKSRVWPVRARAATILALAEQLVELRVEKVTIESTSDYWRIWFYPLEERGLAVQLVNARDVKNAPGRPKTDKQDAVWLARLTEKGMLRPSFVPPAAIRELRDYTRMRVDVVRDRTRAWQRIEKLLEDAQIKISDVASKLTIQSVRDMLEALIAGQRDPRRLAGLARGRMRSKYAELVEALTGRFEDRHAELIRMCLDQIDQATAQIDVLTRRIEELILAMPDCRPPAQDASVPAGGDDGPTAPNQGRPVRLSVLDRLIEVPGIGIATAQTIMAEVGLDMTQFPTPAHLVSWAKLAPRVVQSGSKNTAKPTGKGNPYLKGALAEAAAATTRTNTFLGERYRRLVRRRGKPKALVAVARSILVIVWHLLSDPTVRYTDLGPDYHSTRLDIQRKIKNHVRQLEALGLAVTISPAQAA
jgi:transposase